MLKTLLLRFWRKAKLLVHLWATILFETFETLAAGLEDICAEARDLEVVTVNETVYTVEQFPGGDWKFLALVCGLDAEMPTTHASGANALNQNAGI